MALPIRRCESFLAPSASLRLDKPSALAVAIAVATRVLLAVLALLTTPDLTSKPGALVGLLRQLSFAPTAVGWSSTSNGLSMPSVLVAAQPQNHPLKGQNIDPTLDGSSDGPAPVYTSISLEKLYNIDEKAYSFSAVFQFMFSWRDPRLNYPRPDDNTTGITFGPYLAAMDEAALEEFMSKTSECLTNYTLYKNISDDCKKAMQQEDGCKRLCGIAGLSTNGYQCCDRLWVPTIQIPNIVGITPDNIFSDDLILFGTLPALQKDDPTAVVRIVRMQADFSTTFRFKKFPFDKQVLSVLMVTGSTNYYMVPSVVGRGTLAALGLGLSFNEEGGQASFDPDEVTGWLIDSMELTCDQRNTTTITKALSADPGDPLAKLYKALEVGKTIEADPNTSCTFNIYVSRTSSNYVITLLVPIFLTVLLSFTLFYVPPTDVSTRLQTVIGLFLALTAVQFILNDQLPRTSYATAMSLTILTSYIVMTAIVIESLFVFYITNLEEVWQRVENAKAKILQSKCPQRSEGADDSEQGVIAQDEDDGQVASSEKLVPNISVRGPITFTKRFIDKTFRENSDHAFHVAILIDNVSLIFLSIGYIVATIVIFCVD